MGQMPTPLRSGRGQAQCSRSGGGRRLLLLATVASLGWLALACTANDDVPPAAGSRDIGSEAPAPIDTGVPSGPTDADTPPDTAGDDPPSLEADPLIWVAPKDVRQGSAFVVAAEAPGAGFASVAFNGDVYTLVREGSRFFAILGLDALTPIGPMPLVVSVSNAEGRPVLQQETLITVVDAAWQTEVLELDESNAALLDPVIRAEDAALIDVMLRRETQERHWDGVFDPPSNGVITSNYGLLRSYNFLAGLGVPHRLGLRRRERRPHPCSQRGRRGLGGAVAATRQWAPDRPRGGGLEQLLAPLGGAGGARRRRPHG